MNSNKNLLIGAVAVVLILGGGAVAAASKRSSDDMAAKETEKTAMLMQEKESEAMKMEKDKMMAAASPAAASSDTMMTKESDAMAMKKEAGASFIDYTSEADAQALVANHSSDVVYFFHASWCPDCRAIEAKLQNADELAKLGKNTVVIKVDYDTQTALKAKYKITRQTSFVRIDATGKALKTEILSGFSDLLSF